MWLVVYIVGVVVPFIIWGCILAWRERQAEREQEEAASHNTEPASLA